MCGVSLEAREPSTCDEACLTDECSTCFGDMFEGHEAGCPVSENIPAPWDAIAAALDAAEARERDRWTREVQHRFDTCEARHVDEWRAFAVKMGVVLK
jgi:NADPH-dependent glutamate synthase beta subunit-like oxidoreductase